MLQTPALVVLVVLVVLLAAVLAVVLMLAWAWTAGRQGQWQEEGTCWEADAIHPRFSPWP